MLTKQLTTKATIVARPLMILFLFISSVAIAADQDPSEEESQKYFFSLMQKANPGNVTAENAENYLHGVWRLDKKAHIGGGHYTRADKGDDVSLICNKGLLIQVDFNHNHDKLRQVTEQLSKLKVDPNGSISFGSGRQYKPLDQNHMAIAAYDYIVVLQRISGSAPPSPEKNKSK